MTISVGIYIYKTLNQFEFDVDMCENFCQALNTTLFWDFCGSLSVLPLNQQKSICFATFALAFLSFMELILEHFVSWMPFNIFYRINHTNETESHHVPIPTEEEESAL